MHHVTRKMVHTAWALPSERRSVGPYNTSPERGCMRRVTGRIVNRPIRYVARKMVRLGVSHRPVPPVTVLFPQSPSCSPIHRPVPPVTVLFPQSPFRSPSPCSVPPVTVLFPQSSFCSPVTILFFQSPSCSSSHRPVPPVTTLFLQSPPCSSCHHPVSPVTALFSQSPSCSPSHHPVTDTILFHQSPSCSPVTILPLTGQRGRPVPPALTLSLSAGGSALRSLRPERICPAPGGQVPAAPTVRSGRCSLSLSLFFCLCLSVSYRETQKP